MKNFNKLTGMKLLNLVENGIDFKNFTKPNPSLYEYDIAEMTAEDYEKLKNNNIYFIKPEDEIDDIDFIIKIENSEFELECNIKN